ncbi:hypothetical protein PR048_009394 [Dryococelus australis]|uniref:PiggyBac transposable element-derived protein domain-containing protein n=1 Tax=Dryococelus australis TaxID=614101 RepID=A0ABQ9HZS6_9NEOP|nr:hypothetical protein PR048_009394 [Dryococelus australis]
MTKVRKYLMRQQKTVTIKQIQKYLFLARRIKMNHLQIMTYSFDITRICCFSETTTNSQRFLPLQVVRVLIILSLNFQVLQVMPEYTNQKRLASHGDFLLIGKLLNVFYITPTKKLQYLLQSMVPKMYSANIHSIQILLNYKHSLYSSPTMKIHVLCLPRTELTRYNEKNRLIFLLAALRFDDANTRDEWKETDPLAGISQVFNKLVTNSQSNYTCGQYTTKC